VLDIRWKTFWVIIGFIAIALVIWAITSLIPALAFLCLALTLYIASHIRWIQTRYQCLT